MENTSMLKNGKVDWKRLKILLDEDRKTNGEVLDDIFPKEAQDYLQIQEGHDELGKDSRGIDTTLFGVTEKGCETAYTADRYVVIPGGVPQFIKEAWTALGNKDNQKRHPEEYEALARRVSQYHSWAKSAMFDGWTNGKFSKMPAMSRYATLIQYNSAGGQKMAESLTVQAIRLNNPALLAKSFYSSGKQNEDGTWVLANNGLKEIDSFPKESDKAYKNMANVKLIFSDGFPTKEQYARMEGRMRSDDGKGPVKQSEWDIVDATVDRLVPFYYANQDMSISPEGMRYSNPAAFQGRKQEDKIVGVIDPTLQEKDNQVATAPENFERNNQQKLQTVENARLQEAQSATPAPRTKTNAFDTFVNSFINFTKPLKKLFNTENEVNDANSGNTNDNMQ